MKLQTTIAPRRDGTVIVRGAKNQEHTFKSDEYGDLVCDIEDVDLMKKLLSTGNFFPADEADHAAAAALVRAAQVELDEDLDPDLDPDEDDEPVDMNALPVESSPAPAAVAGEVENNGPQEDEDPVVETGASEAVAPTSRRRRA